MDTALRPMTTSQLLDRTFFLYRRNFILFAGIAMITPMLTTLASLAQLAVFGMPVKPNLSDPASSAAMQAFLARAALGGLVAFSVSIVGYAISSGATVHAVSMLHLGRSTSIKESYDRVKSIWGRLLLLMVRIFIAAAWPIVLCYAVIVVATISIAVAARGNAGAMVGLGLLMLLMMVGLLVGVVWAVITYCRYALAVPACAIEGLPIKYSLIRSKFLTKGSLGRVFVVYILTTFIAIAVSGLLQAPIYMSSNFSIRTGLNLTPGILVWTYACQFIGAMIAGPIAAIAMALVYYDERVRKEAFDLQIMMQAIDGTTATANGAAMSAQQTS